MIRVYYLPVSVTVDIQWVAGEDIIHGALLETTKDPAISKLTMDTTDPEHVTLSGLSVSWSLPSQEELEVFNDIARELEALKEKEERWEHEREAR